VRRLTLEARVASSCAANTKGLHVGNGPALAFEEVYDRNFAFVWRCLRSLGVSPASLDDAAQDVFVVVHRRFAEFRGESSLTTWLFGIARKVAFNHRRSVQRKSQHEVLPPDGPSPAPGPVEHAQDIQAAQFVQDFLAGLDEKKREVFILAVLEELSVPEVAAALAIPLNTAYTRLRRARADFQRALARRREHEHDENA
jgi:RNA polymerase sigma-70 factor (ECF subfamily)